MFVRLSLTIKGYLLTYLRAIQLKVKVRVALRGLETHHRATERHLPYGITQCYLPPDTSERAPP